MRGIRNSICLHKFATSPKNRTGMYPLLVVLYESIAHINCYFFRSELCNNNSIIIIFLSLSLLAIITC